MTVLDIKTKNLKLCIIKSIHAQDVFSILSNEEVLKYYGQKPMQSLDEAMQWVEGREQMLENERGITWGISEKNKKCIIGMCSLFGINRTFFSTLCGYELSPDYWGRDYMREALSSVLKYTFFEMSLNRVSAATSIENKASIKLLETLNFKREGLLRQYGFWHGKFHDAYTYALLSEEWKDTHSWPNLSQKSDDC